MTAPRYEPQQMACELHKVLRGRWLERPAIAEELGVCQKTSDRWVNEYVLQGIAVKRPGRKPPTGCAAAEFSLSREWGGAA